MKYEIELDEEQMETVLDALEFSMRIRLGQFQEIPNNLLVYSDSYRKKYDDVMGFLMDAREIIYPDLGRDSGASYGVENSEKATEIYEIFQVMRHCRAWANNPSGGFTVDFRNPISFSGKQLCKCKAVIDDGGQDKHS